VCRGEWGAECVRRLLEAAVSAAGLLLLSPVLAVVAVLVVVDSGFPIFYRGYRVGRGGRPFRMVKFRTLPNGTEQQVGSRLIRPEEVASTTCLGRLLRKSKLDELPQLWNVLVGEMSLVGPRANRPAYYLNCLSRIPGYACRTLVKPGMTGMAQVFGDYYTPPEKKLRYDRLYLERRSLALDLWLVLMTVARLVRVRRRPRRRAAAALSAPAPLASAGVLAPSERTADRAA